MDYKFDPNAVNDDGGGQQDFEVMPIGDYKMVATAVEAKQTQGNDKFWYFAFTFEIIEGEFKGRNIWNNFNMMNSAACMEIGHREYKRLHDAVGKGATESPNELLNIPFIGTLKIEKGTNGYKDKNQIKTYKPDGVVSTPPASNPTNDSAPASSATAEAGGAVQDSAEKMPWEE